MSNSKDNIFLKNYPVGSIYISENSTSPEDLFGGTWETYGKGRTLGGVDTNQTEFATVGKTGGEKTHLLTIDEMPSHNHELIKNVPFGLPYNDVSGNSSNNGGTVYYGESYTPFNIGYTGGSQSHNNLQPYITVYMWKRIT